MRKYQTGGMAQVVEHLLCKCKALNSTPSPIKEKKKKRKEEISIASTLFK
jgi:hypothetical protein